MTMNIFAAVVACVILVATIAFSAATAKFSGKYSEWWGRKSSAATSLRWFAGFIAITGGAGSLLLIANPPAMEMRVVYAIAGGLGATAILTGMTVLLFSAAVAARVGNTVSDGGISWIR